MKNSSIVRVPVAVPRCAPNEDPNLYIGVNGKTWLLPRGKTSMVPPEVAWEYHRSAAAREAMYRRQDALQERGRA